MNELPPAVTTGLLLVSSVAAMGQSTSAPGTRQEQDQWLRWAIPLPKQISIDQKIELPAAEVRLRLRTGAGDVERNAAAGLTELFRTRANAAMITGRFEILVGVCDRQGRMDDVTIPEAGRLAGLPNWQQAYLIKPVEPNRLILTALDERGVYYAVQTLRQLLEGKFSGGRVTIPLVTVTDWPDLAERGEWGGNVVDEIKWMAGYKMNLVEAHVTLKVTAEGVGVAKTNAERVELGRLNALKLVPIITHLDQLEATDVYTYFPELRGKGATAQHSAFPEEVAPCLSQPRLLNLIADWMSCLAHHKGVTDICVWLTEEPLQCGCASCRKVGQYTLETRAIVKAWRIAQKTYPHIGLRVLLTQGSYSSNDQVIAEIPKDAGVTYYHGGLTYDSSREPMIYPALQQFAASGRWLGCYPQLTASWRIVCPWSGPQFIKYRMNEFVDKKLQCLCGYATPSNRAYDFNITAAAEWSWNARGRSEREFAAAWATRRGFKDPDAVADWATMLGPVGWDVYGSGIPYPHFFGNVAEMIKKRWTPKLGEKMFRYFPTMAHIDNELAICARALEIAKRLDAPLLIGETRVIRGYVQMIRETYLIARALSSKKPPTAQERVELAQAGVRLSDAYSETMGGFRQWEQAIGAEFWRERLNDTLHVTGQTAIALGEGLVSLGMSNPIKVHLLRDVGTWVTEDFVQNARITKKWDVTELIEGPGRYEVGFHYTSGWWGLTILRVALVSAPADRPDLSTELSVDAHEGVAACENKANTYMVKLEKHDPARRYFLVAEIKGVSSKGKPANRQGCNGTVRLRNVSPA